MKIKTIKTLLFLFLFPFMAQIFVSCCTCGSTQFFVYTNCDFMLHHLDNSGEEVILAQTAKVVKEAYGIRVEMEAKEDMCLHTMPISFFPIAAATKCECPFETQYDPLDTIAAIKIFTLQDFDTTHPANAEITDYFKHYTTNHFQSIESFLENRQQVLFYESEFFNHFDLLLVTSPSTAGFYQFELEMELSDGRIISHTTSTIELE